MWSWRICNSNQKHLMLWNYLSRLKLDFLDLSNSRCVCVFYFFLSYVSYKVYPLEFLNFLPLFSTHLLTNCISIVVVVSVSDVVSYISMYFFSGHGSIPWICLPITYFFYTRWHPFTDTFRNHFRYHGAGLARNL